MKRKRRPVKLKDTPTPARKAVSGRTSLAVAPEMLTAGQPPTPAGPSRDEIKPQVLEILNRVANPSTLPVLDEGKNLTDDHGITDAGKENLAPSFTRISRDKYGGLTVSRADSRNCKIVGDSITLVWKRANNDGTWTPK